MFDVRGFATATFATFVLPWLLLLTPPSASLLPPGGGGATGGGNGAGDFFQMNKVVKLSEPYFGPAAPNGGASAGLGPSQYQPMVPLTTNVWNNNARTLVNRLPLSPFSSSPSPTVPASINPAFPGPKVGQQQPHDPFVYQAQAIVQFPVPILIFENQIKNLIIEGRLSSGATEEKIDLRDEQFVDRNVGNLLASINVFDQMISMSKYSNDSAAADRPTPKRRSPT